MKRHGRQNTIIINGHAGRQDAKEGSYALPQLSAEAFNGPKPCSKSRSWCSRTSSTVMRRMSLAATSAARCGWGRLKITCWRSKCSDSLACPRIPGEMCPELSTRHNQFMYRVIHCSAAGFSFFAVALRLCADSSENLEFHNTACSLPLPTMLNREDALVQHLLACDLRQPRVLLLALADTAKMPPQDRRDRRSEGRAAADERPQSFPHQRLPRSCCPWDYYSNFGSLDNLQLTSTHHAEQRRGI